MPDVLRISEIPSGVWNLHPTFNLKINRTNITVAEYLEENNIIWSVGNNQSDIKIYKENLSRYSLRNMMSEFLLIQKRRNENFISLIGEPHEFAPLAYLFANKHNSLAAAPGDKLNRLYYASEWCDPMLEDWYKREDKFCWIARPAPDRIEIAKKIINLGIKIDIYSKESWGLDQWKGYADDELTVAKKYKYRIISENFQTNKYHSEKLFNSIRSGCISFYNGDINLDLTHLGNSFLPLECDLLKNHGDYSEDVLEGINQFMFSSDWEIYSFKSFYKRIIDLARQIIK